MNGLRMACGIVFVVVGVLEAMFFALSICGVGLGGLSASGSLDLDMPQEEGVMLLVVYAVTLVVSGIAMVSHMVGAAHFLRNWGSPVVGWVATIGGMTSVFTCYCGVFTTAATVLGIVTLLVAPSENDEDWEWEVIEKEPGDPFEPPARG